MRIDLKGGGPRADHVRLSELAVALQLDRPIISRSPVLIHKIRMYLMGSLPSVVHNNSGTVSVNPGPQKPLSQLPP